MYANVPRECVEIHGLIRPVAWVTMHQTEQILGFDEQVA